VTIRIDRFPEREGFVPGANYKLYSSRDGGREWAEVLAFRHDDAVPLEEAHVSRFSDDLVVVFMGWTYALTTDGGKIWKTWNAESDLPNWQCCNYRLIQEIHFNTDGTGVMKMNVIDPKRNEVPMLITSDFGGTWTVSGGAV